MSSKILFLFLLLTASLYAQEASPTDEIVVKSVNAMMAQVNANMKLDPGQISEVQSILTDTIVKVRDLQLSLEAGTIDGKTMYLQRQELYNEENRELGAIFDSHQMQVWANIQNPQN